MLKHYRLLVTGSLPVMLEESECPQTPQAWQDLLEGPEVFLYELDSLTLQIVEKTPAEIAAEEAESRRVLTAARQAGERLCREWDRRYRST